MGRRLYFPLASISTNTFKLLLPCFAVSVHKGQSYSLKRKYLHVKETSVMKGLSFLVLQKPRCKNFCFDEYRLKHTGHMEVKFVQAWTIIHSVND